MRDRVTLDVAAFLDSPRARALEAPGPEELGVIIRRFLEACYDDLGKTPRLLDGQDLHEVLGHRLPGRFARRDPLAAHVPVALQAFFAHLEDTEMVSQAYEIRQSLSAAVPGFLAAVAEGRIAHRLPPPPRPFVNGAVRTGRNDPCFCGSGVKFKKCHGKR